MTRTALKTRAVGTSGASEPSNSHLIAHLQSLTLALHIGGLEGLRTGRVKMGDPPPTAQERAAS